MRSHLHNKKFGRRWVVQGDIFDSTFQHIQQYRVIACRSCVFAVVLQQIDRHLRQHQPQTDEKKRSRIAKTGRTLVAVAHSNEEGRNTMCAKTRRHLGYKSTVEWNMAGRMKEVAEATCGGKKRRKKRGKQTLNCICEDKQWCQRFFEC